MTQVGVTYNFCIILFSVLVPGKEWARRIPLRDVKGYLKGARVSPAQLGKKLDLRGHIVRGIWPNHSCSVSLIDYIIGSRQVNDLLGGNKTPA